MSNPELIPFDYDAWVIMGKDLSKVFINECPEERLYCTYRNHRIISLTIPEDENMVKVSYRCNYEGTIRTKLFLRSGTDTNTHDLCLKN